MKTEYKYIEFVEIGKNIKTSIWDCRNKRSGDSLGVVKWYGPWGQYCFWPNGYAIFNDGCLLDIIDFIKQVMSIRKNGDVSSAVERSPYKAEDTGSNPVVTTEGESEGEKHRLSGLHDDADEYLKKNAKMTPGNVCHACGHRTGSVYVQNEEISEEISSEF